jgi:hypothetical protein
MSHSGQLSSLSNCSALSPVSAGGRPVGVECSMHPQGDEVAQMEAVAVPKM